jgi:hypothetical protein
MLSIARIPNPNFLIPFLHGQSHLPYSQPFLQAECDDDVAGYSARCHKEAAPGFPSLACFGMIGLSGAAAARHVADRTVASTDATGHYSTVNSEVGGSDN